MIQEENNRSRRKAASHNQEKIIINNIQISLENLLGAEFIHKVAGADAALRGTNPDSGVSVGREPVDFYPPEFAKRSEEVLSLVGNQVCDPLGVDEPGATTHAFTRATSPGKSPLGGFGCVRVGQDGRGYLISKSEHYHASLGHGFPGYALCDNARRMGLNDVTHNNTRGFITRTLERRIVAACHGRDPADPAMDGILESTESGVLNRVINLETGSLAVEAGLKLLLARFFAFEENTEDPPYRGRIPVFLVMGDLDGGITANYHGTTILTQVLRGLWPELGRKLETDGSFVVKPVPINDIDAFREAVDTYDAGPYKVAGFFHEIVLMNYGCKLLTPEYLHAAHGVCRERDIPVLVDEIQSCAWSPEHFLFREYGLTPDIVTVGKGLPGGTAPASRIVTTAAMDRLSQFGALVTNGQEEIASLRYLITMAFVEANGEAMRRIGEAYESGLRELSVRYAGTVTGIEGMRHLCGIAFKDMTTAGAFAKAMNAAGFDISAQTYKPNGLPITITKIPMIASAKTVEFILDEMDRSLTEISR